MRGPFVMMAGPAGSGKSTYVSRAYLPSAVVSLNDLRYRLTGDPGDQAATDEAVEVARKLVYGRLRRGLLTVLDSTAARPEIRRWWAELAATADAPARLVIAATPLEECLRRNARRPAGNTTMPRGPQVPEDVLRRQHAGIVDLLAAVERLDFPFIGGSFERIGVLRYPSSYVEGLYDAARVQA